jgi:hypothetical protein
VTKAQALKHPNWDMGAKITIDSASLMNKGLEAIEAKWLFNLKREQIEIIVHPQSIIHSIVQFRDGSMKAQMGLPDMKLPIQYAMAYPDRLPTSWPRFDFVKYPALTFEQPDLKTFRNLALALEAMDRGGNAPCVLNAANEVAVELFLQDAHRLPGDERPDRGYVWNTVPFIPNPSLADLEASDAEARRVAREKPSLPHGDPDQRRTAHSQPQHPRGAARAGPLPSRPLVQDPRGEVLPLLRPWFSLFKKKMGDTEYGIGWFPFGGYVKISGMVDESMDKEQLAKPPEPWEFRSKPAWQRLIIMVGGVTVNLLLGMAIYIGILFTWGRDYLPRG